MPRIDMSTVETGRKLVDIGKHTARLTKVSYGVSGAGNTTQVFEFTFSDPDSEFVGRKASVSKAITDAKGKALADALWSYKPILAALGMPDERIKAVDFDSDEVGPYVGREVTLQIEHRQSNQTEADGSPRLIYSIEKVLPLQTGLDWGHS